LSLDTASMLTPFALSFCLSDVIYIATFEVFRAVLLKIHISQSGPLCLKDEDITSCRNVGKYLPVDTS
jgi:hypothetical protein